MKLAGYVAPERSWPTSPLLAGIALGGFVALQSHANGELARSIDDPLGAGVVSYAVGVATLIVLLAVWKRPARRPDATLGQRPAVWWFVGSLTGAMFVVAAAAATPAVGVVTFTIAVTAGHLAGSLVVDHLGIGPRGRQPLDVPRFIGTAVGIIGVVLANAEGSGTFSLPIAAGLFLVGGAVPVGAAANGRLKASFGSARKAALVNFSVGLALVAVLTTALRGWPPVALQGDIPWWDLTGGVLGAFWLAGSAALVGRTGVLRLFLTVTAGQLAASVVMDLAVPVSDDAVTVARLLGGFVVLAGVWIVSRGSPTVESSPAK